MSFQLLPGPAKRPGVRSLLIDQFPDTTNIYLFFLPKTLPAILEQLLTNLLLNRKARQYLYIQVLPGLISRSDPRNNSQKITGLIPCMVRCYNPPTGNPERVIFFVLTLKETCNGIHTSFTIHRGRNNTARIPCPFPAGKQSFYLQMHAGFFVARDTDRRRCTRFHSHN